MRFMVSWLMVAISATAAFAEDWREKAVKSFQDEKSIVEVMFSAPGSLWVSMRDDGSRRDGFAEYLCVRAMQEGMPSGESFVIHIWDAAAMAAGDMKEIGYLNCYKSE